MQLTRHTDYALRILIHLAVTPTGRATIPRSPTLTLFRATI